MPVSSKADHAPTLIEFSGYTWKVTNATRPAAPGPNFWSNTNVFVDSEGRLHLRLTKNELTGLWSCAEVVSQQSFGTGTYEFFVEGAIDRLDRNAVFGIFQYSGVDMHDEIDIEYSKWGNKKGTNLTYTVWPKKGMSAKYWSSKNTVSLEGTYTTQRMIRTDSDVIFQSLHGFRTDAAYAFHTSRCSRKSIISSEAMPLYLNLWLFKGQPPIDGEDIEIIIHKFSFAPGN